VVVNNLLIAILNVCGLGDLERQIAHDERKCQECAGVEHERHAKLFSSKAARKQRNISKIFSGDECEVRGIAGKNCAEAREPGRAKKFSRDQEFGIACNSGRRERGRLCPQSGVSSRLQKALGLKEDASAAFGLEDHKTFLLPWRRVSSPKKRMARVWVHPK